MGAAMKPDLAADDRPAGPQVIAEGPQAPPSGPFDDRAAHASYGGEIPEYVLGTDWKKLTQAQSTGGLYLDDGYAAAADEAPAAEVGTYAAAVYREPAAASASLDGDAAYADASRAENTPIVHAVDIDEEAPPEATGDTTPSG
jgi:hypothetical protein